MKHFLLFSILIVFVSCMKLDDIAFYNEPLLEYQLDDYDVELDFKLDSSFDVDDIHQFSLESDDFYISALYIGNVGQIDEDTIILYCHGQSLHMDHYWQRAKLLANCGSNQRFGILMFDYR